MISIHLSFHSCHLHALYDYLYGAYLIHFLPDSTFFARVTCCSPSWFRVSLITSSSPPFIIVGRVVSVYNIFLTLNFNPFDAVVVHMIALLSCGADNNGSVQIDFVQLFLMIATMQGGAHLCIMDTELDLC